MGNNRVHKADVVEDIKPVSDDDLPPEFKKFDVVCGMPQHVFNFIVLGIFTHACMLYTFFYLWPMGIVPFGSVLFGKFKKF